jgi:hypothetical protein
MFVRKRQSVAMVCVSFLSVAFLGSAMAASAAGLVHVANTTDSSAPRVLVDRKGTVSVAWTSANSSGQTMIDYAREPKGSTHFTKVKLPRIANVDYPFLYEASPGVLQIIATQESGDFAQDAWRSTNDGKSWKIMNTDALKDTSLRSHGIFLQSQYLTLTAGGPAEYTGDNGDPSGVAVQFNSSLTRVTTIATNTQSLNFPQVGRTATGATYLMDTPSNSFTTDVFTVGTHVGHLSFPSCATAPGRPQLAVGHSGAVVAFSGCGHTYARTISTAGKVGKLVKVGPSLTTPGSSGGPWLDLVADRNGHYTMAFTVSGGDLQIAHSSNGSRWTTTATRLIPAAVGLTYQSNGAVSLGAATWYAEATRNPNASTYNVLATSLAATYQVPKSPSGHGIAHPRRGRIGSLAVVVPGKISVKAVEHSGRIKVRMVDALASEISVGVALTSSSGGTVNYFCNSGATVKLKARHAKLVTELCQGVGPFAIPRSGSPAVSATAKKSVTFTFSGRNGTLTLVSPAH